MRIICILALLSIFLALPLAAQSPASPDRFGAFGIGYFSQATPQFQGWAALGIPLTSDHKAISYTDMDISVSKSAGQNMISGHQMTYSVHPGLAYRVFLSGSWSLYALAAPGFVADGSTFQSSFEYGGFLHKSLGSGWGALIALTKEQYGAVSDLAPRIGITKKF